VAPRGGLDKRLERTARDLGNRLYYGAGMVNARRAIAR
jgi:hypothetical protein